LRRGVLHAIPQAAREPAPSEMERGQPRRRASGLASLRPGGRLDQAQRRRRRRRHERGPDARYLRQIPRRAQQGERRRHAFRRSEGPALRAVQTLAGQPLTGRRGENAQRPSIHLPLCHHPRSRLAHTQRALGLAAASLALAALSTEAAAQSAAPKRGGVLEFAVDAEPPSYDCHANVSFAFLHPVAPHYSTLLKFNGADYPQVKGDLAESWSVSSDKLTYTFKLR